MKIVINLVFVTRQLLAARLFGADVFQSEKRSFLRCVLGMIFAWQVEAVTGAG